MNFSALYRNLVRFGPVTLELTMLKVRTFAVALQKLAYHAKYLTISWIDLIWLGMINLTFVWWSLKDVAMTSS